MPNGKTNDGLEKRRLGLYLALSQVGIEMVVPIGLGVWLDRWLGLSPWLTLTGVLLGFVGGLAHLIVLTNKLHQQDDAKASGQRKS